MESRNKSEMITISFKRTEANQHRSWTTKIQDFKIRPTLEANMNWNYTHHQHKTCDDNVGLIETKPPPYEETNDTNTMRDQKASPEQHHIRNAMNHRRCQSAPWQGRTWTSPCVASATPDQTVYCLFHKPSPIQNNRVLKTEPFQ